ncbi:MAG: ribonuclease HI [Chloroflexi bacterium]|nr:ribonuclease HI [Chloroflexota bacterium]
MAKQFTCRDCRKEFSIDNGILARYPGWTPKQCLNCRPSQSSKSQPNEALSTSGTLEHFAEGPSTGLFTDGHCEPNPGKGGWGAVKVIDGTIIAECSGGDTDTTNNRMELKALIEGFRLLSPDETISVFSDSQLCVKTVTTWAASWKRKGWTRGKKKEPVKNLDLVQELYELAQAHPMAKLEWIKGHAGLRWNEYADALARSGGAASGEENSA